MRTVETCKCVRLGHVNRLVGTCKCVQLGHVNVYGWTCKYVRLGHVNSHYYKSQNNGCDKIKLCQRISQQPLGIRNIPNTLGSSTRLELSNACIFRWVPSLDQKLWTKECEKIFWSGKSSSICQTIAFTHLSNVLKSHMWVYVVLVKSCMDFERCNCFSILVKSNVSCLFPLFNKLASFKIMSSHRSWLLNEHGTAGICENVMNRVCTKYRDEIVTLQNSDKLTNFSKNSTSSHELLNEQCTAGICENVMNCVCTKYRDEIVTLQNFDKLTNFSKNSKSSHTLLFVTFDPMKET